MKLIDILAREIFAWPTAMVRVRQNKNGCLVWLDANGLDTLGSHLQMAEDWLMATLTHNEWIAAVTALKAKEVNFNDPMSMNGQVAAEWNGEGLPPVGTEFESKVGKEWCECIAVAHDRGIVVFRRYFKGSEYGLYGHCYAGSDQMRPIRTAEQIAAYYRAKEITRLSEITGLKVEAYKTVFEAIIDSDYRKQVAK